MSLTDYSDSSLTKCKMNISDSLDDDNDDEGVSTPLSLDDDNDDEGVSTPLSLDDDNDDEGVSTPLSLDDDNDDEGVSTPLSLDDDNDDEGVSTPLSLDDDNDDEGVSTPLSLDDDDNDDEGVSTPLSLDDDDNDDEGVSTPLSLDDDDNDDEGVSTPLSLDDDDNDDEGVSTPTNCAQLTAEEEAILQEDYSQIRFAKNANKSMATYSQTKSKGTLHNKTYRHSQFVDYEGAFMRKTTALYLLQENPVLSSDRLIRVRKDDPKSASKSAQTESVVSSGNLCVFRRIDCNKIVIGRVVQFSYLEGNKRPQEYSSMYVDLTKDSYKSIGAFANWFCSPRLQ